MYVLEKDKRTENKATLHVTGRDIEDMQLLLEFDRDMTVWRFVSYLSGEPSADTLTPVLVKFLSSRKTFSGTATELLDGLKGIDGGFSGSPNSLTRLLKEHALTLEKQHHISMGFTRTKSARLVSLSMGDGDGQNICRGKGEIPSPPAGDDSAGTGVHE